MWTSILPSTVLCLAQVVLLDVSCLCSLFSVCPALRQPREVSLPSGQSICTHGPGQLSKTAEVASSSRTGKVRCTTSVAAVTATLYQYCRTVPAHVERSTWVYVCHVQTFWNVNMQAECHHGMSCLRPLPHPPPPPLPPRSLWASFLLVIRWGGEGQPLHLPFQIVFPFSSKALFPHHLSPPLVAAGLQLVPEMLFTIWALSEEKPALASTHWHVLLELHGSGVTRTTSRGQRNEALHGREADVTDASVSVYGDRWSSSVSRGPPRRLQKCRPHAHTGRTRPRSQGSATARNRSELL